MDEEKIGVSVLNLGTVKPLDEKGILEFAKKNDALVTVEEHQIAGGMGSAVAELLARKHPTKIEFVGIKDKFGQSGTPEELVAHYGMDVPSIKKAVKKLIK